jgi:hypothetical protein
MLPPPFEVTTNTYQIISKMQRECVKDFYMLATPFMKEKIRNQQMTSQTSMLWTCNLSSKISSNKSMKDYNL